MTATIFLVNGYFYTTHRFLSFHAETETIFFTSYNYRHARGEVERKVELRRSGC